MGMTVIDQIMERVKSLPAELQVQVLQFATQLAFSARTGVSGASLLKFAGSIPPEEIEQMRQAIERDCEHVDEGEW